MTAKTSYRIVSLVAENLKRLHAVSIKPDGSLVEITGKNGSGKSSTLDAIFFALAGTAVIPATPIRKGQKNAVASVDLGDLKVTRKFAAKDDGGYTTSLTVENADGARYSSPQSILDALIGQLAFDPLEFTRMKPKAQFDMLRRFVADFDFEANAAARKRAFDDRTDVNRRLKDIRAQAAGIVVSDDTPDEEIDVTALAAELQEVGEHNAQVEQRKANRDNLRADIDRRLAEVTDLEARADALRKQADAIDQKAVEVQKTINADTDRLAKAGPLPEPKDASAITARIEQANAVNAAVRDKLRRGTLLSNAQKVELDATGLTNEIERLDAVKATAISSAKMPVDGLGFADDYITLDGLPFEQASSAEQLRASIAIAIAANPKLRVLIVRDGALLDDESMGIVAEMAEANDVQIWVESVQSGRPSAVVIEDGMVAGAEEAKAA